MKPNTWGARLRDYWRWKLAQELYKMEQAAKRDIQRLKAQERKEQAA